MIDAGPSLQAAKGLSARALLACLRSTGWTQEPSRVEGIAILSKTVAGADGPIEFILPERPGFGDEQRRVAGALRTIEALEARPISSVVDDVRKLTAHGGKKSRGTSSTPTKKKRATLTASENRNV
jgi:hypothetical protein